MNSSFKQQCLSKNSVNSVEPLIVSKMGDGQYRAKPWVTKERVTTISPESRVQENSKRRAPLASIKGDDIVWSLWKHKEQYCESNIAKHKRLEVHLPSVESLALAKPYLIDLEILKRVTGAKICYKYISSSTERNEMDIDTLGKHLRDILLGDATLSNPVSSNAGSILQITHENKQLKWLKHKVKILSDLGFTFKFAEGNQEYSYKEGSFDFTMAYTPSSKFLRFLYDRWYYIDSNGKRKKNYEVMFKDYLIDLETFVIFFLDNGCIDTRNGYLKAFIFSTNLQDSGLFLKKLENFKFAVRSYNPNEQKSRFVLGTKRAKERFRDLLKDYCEKNDLQDVFAYKYNLPISHAERLNDGGHNI